MQRHGLSNYLPFESDFPQQNFEDCDEMDMEFFSSAESSSLSIPTDEEEEDFTSESTQDASFITTRSDVFSLIHQNNSFTESLSTEDTLSTKGEEIDDFYITTNGREAFFIEQSDENGEAEEIHSNEGEDNDSNANTLEQSLILQGLRMDEDILVPDQWNLWGPLETIIEEQSTIATTDDEGPTLAREKQLGKRASIWDCCGFWSCFHAHKD